MFYKGLVSNFGEFGTCLEKFARDLQSFGARPFKVREMFAKRLGLSGQTFKRFAKHLKSLPQTL